jgi:hypothetical protein
LKGFTGGSVLIHEQPSLVLVQLERILSAHSAKKASLWCDPIPSKTRTHRHSYPVRVRLSSTDGKKTSSAHLIAHRCGFDESSLEEKFGEQRFDGGWIGFVEQVVERYRGSEVPVEDRQGKK